MTDSIQFLKIFQWNKEAEKNTKQKCTFNTQFETAELNVASIETYAILFSNERNL